MMLSSTYIYLSLLSLLSLSSSQHRAWKLNPSHFGGSSGGITVRALGSRPCDLDSISRLCVICGLSLLVLFSDLRGFSAGTPVFPFLQKPAFD